jgi:hypothetical protein
MVIDFTAMGTKKKPHRVYRMTTTAPQNRLRCGSNQALQPVCLVLFVVGLSEPACRVIVGFSCSPLLLQKDYQNRQSDITAIRYHGNPI